MIEFACHQCKTRLKVKDTAAGQTVACPRCQVALTIPGDKLVQTPLAKPLNRHPLGDPPPGESSDPAQRVVELANQNRELQEKLRRKETELELARLKIADLAKSGVGEAKPVVPEETRLAPSPAVPAVEPVALGVPAPTPVPAGSGWGMRVFLILLVAIIAGVAWYSGRKSRPAPIPVPVTMPVKQMDPAPVEPKMVVPPPVAAVEPMPVPAPAVIPVPVIEVAPSPVKEPEPPKPEPVEKPMEAGPSPSPTNGSVEAESAAPPAVPAP